MCQWRCSTLNICFQTIKVLKQRVSDFKKTLQHELKTNHSNNGTENADTNNPNNRTTHTTTAYNSSHAEYGDKTIIMDDVNFKYLKHVILKFLTSREVSVECYLNFLWALTKDGFVCPQNRLKLDTLFVPLVHYYISIRTKRNYFMTHLVSR